MPGWCASWCAAPPWSASSAAAASQPLDGREFEFAAVPLPDGNALFTMLDVTDSRCVEAALRERNEALEEADRLKTAFVSNMSYELRTPLTSIGGFAEMLAGGYAGELPPPRADYVGAILESVARLSALIDNVLDLTQSDSGSLLLAEEEVDLAAMCRRRAEASRARWRRRKGIDFASRSSRRSGIVTGDRRRLGQALDNILKNALRLHAAKAGASCSTRRRRARRRGSPSPTTAPASPPADQARVFDRFHRTHAARGGGARARRSASACRSPSSSSKRMAARSSSSRSRGEGTTVTIRLPREQRLMICAGRRRKSRPRRSGARWRRCSAGRRRSRCSAISAPARRPRARHPARARLRRRCRQPDLSDRPAYEELALPLWHVDLYRIEDPASSRSLALDEALRTARCDRMAGAARRALWPHALRSDIWRRGGGRARLDSPRCRPLGGADGLPDDSARRGARFPCRTWLGGRRNPPAGRRRELPPLLPRHHRGPRRRC
jgi:signal transduction histidine kinase